MRPPAPSRTVCAVVRKAFSAGFQPKLALRLGDELRAIGLQGVVLKGLMFEVCGASDHPGGKVYRMTIERLRERMVKARLLTNAAPSRPRA